MADERICTRKDENGIRCTNPATEKHLWCKGCKAKYQRDYRETEDEMAEGRGFAAGAEAMRQSLVMQFRVLPANAMLACCEAASIVSRAPAPQRQKCAQVIESLSPVTT